MNAILGRYLVFKFFFFKRKKATVNEFARQVCLQEKGKDQVNIAQVLQILKIVNRLLDGRLYKWIKLDG